MSDEHVAALEKRRAEVDARGEVYESTVERLDEVAMTVKIFHRKVDNKDAIPEAAEAPTPLRQRRQRTPTSAHWSCPACTLENPISTITCDACGGERSRSLTASSGEGQQQVEDVWACPVCMLDNALGSAECAACYTRRPPGAGPLGRSRVFQTEATLPIDISFPIPRDFCQGQEFLEASGPHGPVPLRVPEGSRPGQWVTVRLGPHSVYRIAAPEDAKEGDMLMIEPPGGEAIQFQMPPGKKGGDEFRLTPRVLMVRVPDGAGPGDWVGFRDPDGAERMACVPEGMSPGLYFDVPLDRMAL